MPHDTPVNISVSLQDWLQADPEIFAESLPLVLMQTYQEWLQENPQGFHCGID